MARARSITEASIAEAAALLRAGELVSLPTETVYGLGANALDDTAVAKIYAAKNRPSFNPLIVHVPDVATARQYAQFNDLAEHVAETLWPGPLSIVLPRTEACALSKLVSAGLDTVAIRIPASPHARRLFAVADIPVAAPSANKSNRLSPTEARHVADNFGKGFAGLGWRTLHRRPGVHGPRPFNGHANAAPRRRHGSRRFGSRDRTTSGPRRNRRPFAEISRYVVTSLRAANRCE